MPMVVIGPCRMHVQAGEYLLYPSPLIRENVKQEESNLVRCTKILDHW